MVALMVLIMVIAIILSMAVPMAVLLYDRLDVEARLRYRRHQRLVAAVRADVRLHAVLSHLRVHQAREAVANDVTYVRGLHADDLTDGSTDRRDRS